MARATAELRRISATERSPRQILTDLHRSLKSQSCDDTFVTAACVRLDSRARRAVVANAGHVVRYAKCSVLVVRH